MGKSNDAKGNLIIQSMEEVMHASMMPYAEYVILDRAIPRVEDGLKPVQRRILYTMMELGMTPDKPHRKSARIVGDCLGKYHPHGDTSVYDAMVRMAQDFNMQCPLVNGHGNFGSIDGDPPAAMRYTEARMAPLALELLRDIDKDTVRFSFNFDDTLKEPDMLPGRFPNLLVNGATGIAVGLATNIPPHNLGEAIDAAVAVLEQPDISLKRVMKVLKAPDFPTGGYLLEASELEKAYETGKGRVVIRAKTHYEHLKNGRKLIVVDELPYQVNKASALEKILRLSEEKKTLFAPITDIRDESDRNGMRAVIELKKEADPEKVLAYLLKYSDLQVNFNINMVAIAQGKPQLLGLLEVLRYYTAYQKEVVTRRTRFDLAAAERRAHILAGLIVAVDNIDEVIRLIRTSQTPAEARGKLMERFALSEAQAQAILDMRLQRLTGLSIIELKKEHAELLTQIGELRAILSDESKLVAVIKKELLAIKKQYGQPRRTQFLNAAPVIEIDETELTVAEDVVVFMSAGGIKRMNAKLYAAKGSGEEGRVLFEVASATNRRVQFFTNLGNMYAVDVADIPELKGKERGVIPSGLLNGWQDREKILAAFSFLDCREDESLLFISKKGMVKRTLLSQYNTRSKRIAAVGVKEGDEILAVAPDNGCESLLCVTRLGMSIRFAANTVPEMGRAAAGVKAMILEEDDELIYAGQLESEGELFIISDRGYGKRTLLCDYDIQGRNGKGVKTFDFKKNRSNGEMLAACLRVKEPRTLFVQQAHGDVTAIDSESVPIRLRLDKGMPLVIALLDNLVVDAY